MRLARFTLLDGEPIALPPEHLGVFGKVSISQVFVVPDPRGPLSDLRWGVRDAWRTAADEIDAARAEFPPVVVVGNNNAVGTEADIEKRFPLRTLTQEGGDVLRAGGYPLKPLGEEVHLHRVLHNQAFEAAATQLERLVAGSDHEDVEPEVAVRRVLSDLLAQVEVKIEQGSDHD